MRLESRCARGIGGGATSSFDGSARAASAPATLRSDIYAVGVLLDFMVTGTYPVTGAPADVKQAHREGRRTPLDEQRPDLPEEFVRVVEKAAAPHHEARYESAVALLAAAILRR